MNGLLNQGLSALGAGRCRFQTHGARISKRGFVLFALALSIAPVQAQSARESLPRRETPLRRWLDLQTFSLDSGTGSRQTTRTFCPRTSFNTRNP